MQGRICCALLGLGVVALTACAPTPEVEAPGASAAPPQFPTSLYREAARAGEEVYRVSPRSSRLIVHVRSEGPLAPTLGHSHVVSTGRLHGFIMPGANRGQADIYLAVADLVVDDPALRQAAGYTSELSAEEIAATRSNMLSEVLEARQYPYVRLHLDSPPPAGAEGPHRLNGELTLHGQTRSVAIPARISRFGEGLRATGAFRITHRQFGMQPYSALAGALRVSEQLHLHFDLLAYPLHDR